MAEDEEKNSSIAVMIAKVELSAEIARIGLACENCCHPIRDAINRFKNRNKIADANVNVNPDRGHSSLQATNESMDGLPTEAFEVSSNEINRQQYT